MLRPLLRPRRRLVVVEASAGQLEDELRLALSHAGVQRPSAIDPSAGWAASCRRSARSSSTCLASEGGGRMSTVFYESSNATPTARGSRGTRRTTARAAGTAWRTSTSPRRSTSSASRTARSPSRRSAARLPLLLLRRREHAGRARPRAGRGARPQDREPRLDRHQLPGRRRSGVDRPGGDRQHGADGDPDHGHLHQQRDLRHDRRADGADHAHRPDDDDDARTGARSDGAAAEDGGADRRSSTARSTSSGSRCTTTSSASGRRRRSGRRCSCR